MISSILIIRESSLSIIEDLRETLTKHEIVVKIIKDDEFDIFFPHKTQELSIDLTDEQFMYFAQEAHRQDITFNQLFNKALKEFIENEK